MNEINDALKEYEKTPGLWCLIYPFAIVMAAVMSFACKWLMVDLPFWR